MAPTTRSDRGRRSTSPSVRRTASRTWATTTSCSSRCSGVTTSARTTSSGSKTTTAAPDSPGQAGGLLGRRAVVEPPDLADAPVAQRVDVEEGPVVLVTGVGPVHRQMAEHAVGPLAGVGDAAGHARGHQARERRDHVGAVAARAGVVVVAPPHVVGEQRTKPVEVPVLEGPAELVGDRRRRGHGADTRTTPHLIA